MNPHPKESPSEQRTWERGWDGHELEQLRRLARLSLPEKLAWLEEAHRLVRQLAAAKEVEAKSDQ